MERLNYKLREQFEDGEKLLLANERLLSQFEADAGYIFPPDYRLFVKRYGGASLYDVVFKLSIPDPRFDTDDVFSVDDFLGFYSEMNPIWDIRANYHEHKEIFPPGVVAFAKSGENRFCLSCSGETLDNVYGWMPPEFDDDDQAGELVLLARTFLDFLRGLRISDD